MIVKLKRSYRSKPIESALDAYLIFRDLLMSLDTVDTHREHMWVMGLSSNGIIKYIDLASIGTLTALVAGPREIFTHAVRYGGIKSIIICHNHPSGSIQPSKEDVLFTEKISEAGKILDVKLMDHLVISHKSYYSFNGVKNAKGGKDE